MGSRGFQSNQNQVWTTTPGFDISWDRVMRLDYTRPTCHRRPPFLPRSVNLKGLLFVLDHFEVEGGSEILSFLVLTRPIPMGVRLTFGWGRPDKVRYGVGILIRPRCGQQTLGSKCRSPCVEPPFSSGKKRSNTKRYPGETGRGKTK